MLPFFELYQVVSRHIFSSPVGPVGAFSINLGAITLVDNFSASIYVLRLLRHVDYLPHMRFVSSRNKHGPRARLVLL